MMIFFILLVFHGRCCCLSWSSMVCWCAVEEPPSQQMIISRLTRGRSQWDDELWGWQALANFVDVFIIKILIEKFYGIRWLWFKCVLVWVWFCIFYDIQQSWRQVYQQFISKEIWKRSKFVIFPYGETRRTSRNMWWRSYQQGWTEKPIKIEIKSRYQIVV